MPQPDYTPTVSNQRGDFRVTALVGGHSASIAWDVAAADRVGLRGFAVRRTEFLPGTDDVERVRWLNGQKRFADNVDLGVDVPSDQAPFQRFRWNDYTLKEDRWYRYEVFQMRGDPGNLDRGDPLVTDLVASPGTADGSAVTVNRGVTAAPAYLSRFGGVDPQQLPAARSWLSRGLEESLIAFIERAAGPGDTLHVSIYEMHHKPIAEALKDAQRRGAVVKIVLHYRNDRASEESEHVLRDVGLWSQVYKRTNVNISHNKFVVHLHDDVPLALWTGSANFSFNAFYLQTNQAVVLEDPTLVDAYEQYWQIIKDDPEKGITSNGLAPARPRIADLMGTVNPNLGNTKVLFSPVSTTDVLDEAITLVSNAQSAVFISAPFGIRDPLAAAVNALPDNILTYGLTNNTAVATLRQLRTNTRRLIVPSKLETWMGRAWDAKAFGAHKVHSKLIVVDPWGANPKVMVGSANFSKASCRDNDENTLLVSGDRRLAAILATEFIRMFDHYNIRDFIKKLRQQGPTEEHFLDDTDAWSDTAFNPNARSHKYRDRQVFSGQQ